MTVLHGVWRRAHSDLQRIGASLPLRLALLALALLLHLGFFLPKVPDVGGADGIPGLDKIVHIGVFALTVWAAGRLLAPIGRFPIGWVAIAAFAQAWLIELVQSTMPNRAADPMDVLADVAGIAVGLLAWHLERRRRLAMLAGDVVEDAAPDETVGVPAGTPTA